MEQQLVAVNAQPCVWMCAGLVSYRLCSRDFDCEHCPLDAALRGELHPVAHDTALLYRQENGNGVPADRRYSSGHTWALPTAEAGYAWRIGIDAFAATLIGCARSITCEPFEHLNAREPLCTIDLGVGTSAKGSRTSCSHWAWVPSSKTTCTDPRMLQMYSLSTLASVGRTRRSITRPLCSRTDATVVA